VIGNCRPQLNGMRGIYYYTSAAGRTLFFPRPYIQPRLPFCRPVYILYDITYTDIILYIYMCREILGFCPNVSTLVSRTDPRRRVRRRHLRKH